MISENDIYLRMTPAATEDIRLTDTGIPGVIYNGMPDWLYQEEVLPIPQAIWPSPDGTHILYATFNDTRVNALQFPWFGTQLGQDGSGSSPLGTFKRGSFPPSKSVRYPTPGSPNPEVDLWIMDLGNVSFTNYTGNSTKPEKRKLKPPSSLDGQYVKLLKKNFFYILRQSSVLIKFVLEILSFQRLLSDISWLGRRRRLADRRRLDDEDAKSVAGLGVPCSPMGMRGDSLGESA